MSKKDQNSENGGLQVNHAHLAPLMKIRQIVRFAQRHSAAIERRCGVNGGQLWLMTEIAESPGMRIGDLAKRLAAHQTTVSNLTDELLKKELVVKTSDERDRRASVLTLTTKGIKVLSKAPTPTRGVLPEALSQLDKKTIIELDRALKKLISTMEGIDEEFGLQLLPFNLSAK